MATSRFPRNLMLIAGKRTQHHIHERSYLNWRNDYADEVTIAAHVDQTDAVAVVAIEQKMIAVDISCRRRQEPARLPEHTHHARLRPAKPRVGDWRAVSQMLETSAHELESLRT